MGRGFDCILFGGHTDIPPEKDPRIADPKSRGSTADSRSKLKDMREGTGRLGEPECIGRQDTRMDVVGIRIVVQTVDMLASRLMSKEHLEEHLRAQTPRSAFLQVDPSSQEFVGASRDDIPAFD